MKITPLGSNQVGTLDQTTGRSTNEAKERAKAAYAGEATITPSDTPVDPSITRQNTNIKRLTMKTNASPERYAQEIAQAAEPVSDNPVISESTETSDVTSEETKPLSPQFAALAKQRRALQVKERELADREKALASKPATDTDLIAKLKSQPLSVLQEHGVTYDQLTEALLAEQGGSQEVRQLREELKALKEGVDTKLQDRDTAAEKAALAEMRKEAEALSKEGDAYEMVRETRSMQDVMDLIEKTYRSTGEVLDVTVALQLVEDELIKESVKIANIKKVQSQLAPQPAPITQSATSPKFKTLTNRDNAQPQMSAKARAMAAFNGTLKK